jgi:hypothetical protein
MTNDWRDDDADEVARDADYRAVLQRVTANFARLEALHAPPDPVKAMRQVMDLLERALKIQGLLRKAYPKRSRLARRNRRRAKPS